MKMPSSYCAGKTVRIYLYREGATYCLEAEENNGAAKNGSVKYVKEAAYLSF